MRLTDPNEILKSEHQYYDYMSDEYYVLVRDIKNAPTIEAEPIKHGRWIEEGLVDGNQNRYCRCSECGKGDTQAISQRVPYCWWCGAKMDLTE